MIEGRFRPTYKIKVHTEFSRNLCVELFFFSEGKQNVVYTYTGIHMFLYYYFFSLNIHSIVICLSQHRGCYFIFRHVAYVDIYLS